MNRLTVRLTTFIDLIGLLTLALELILVYSLRSYKLTLILICLLLGIFTHVFLRVSHNYDSVFLFSFILVLFSSIIIGFIYMKGFAFSLLYKQQLLFIILLNWLIPFIYCILSNLHDARDQYEHFTSYFKKTSIQFLIYYFAFIIVIIAIRPMTTSCISVTAEQTLNITSEKSSIPFYTIATYIEDSIYNKTDILPLIKYIGVSLLLMIPYGFYISILLKRFGHIVRLLAFILFPIAIETSKQYIFNKSGSLEHVLLELAGCLIGSLLYYLLSSRYYRLRHHEFLEGNTYFRL